MLELWNEYGTLISWTISIASAPTLAFLLPAKYAGIIVNVLKFGVEFMDRLAKTKPLLSTEKDEKADK